jgi:hypothetical protein
MAIITAYKNAHASERIYLKDLVTELTSKGLPTSESTIKKLLKGNIIPEQARRRGRKVE